MAKKILPIRVGVSGCLLGEEIRFNGQHKRDSFINNILSQYFDFVSICPEVGIGMGVPREPIRLVQVGSKVVAREVTNPTKDFSKPLKNYVKEKKDDLVGLSGYILKRGSPSCGMERVRLYSDKNNIPSKQGVGIYASQLMAEYPNLPVEEEGRLSDPVLRENFLERVFVYHRWLQLNQQTIKARDIVDFHTQHKLQILAHNQAGYRRLGQLVANAGSKNINGLAKEYISELMELLKRRCNRKSHTNVLYHLMGYLKKVLDSKDKEAMQSTIEQYRTGVVPLIVPITLLNYFFAKYPNEYVQNQYYLEPHPAELMLRNLV